MTTLEDRARKAAAAVHEAAAEYRPVADIAVVARRSLVAKTMTWSFAAALVALVLSVGAWWQTIPDRTTVADDLPPTTAATLPPTVATTAPVEPSLPEPPVVDPEATPVPGDGTTTESTPSVPPETTTSVIADTTPPTLSITSPDDGARFAETVIAFAGITEPGAEVWAGPYQATVDDAGHWSIVLVLSPGSNRATFRAVDEAGNESTASVTVFYDPPVTTTEATTTTTTKPPEEPPAYEFTAYQVYGECAEPVPYDIFYGTAFPGEKIRVLSEYGAGVVYADETGNWEIRVEFPEAPFGKEFVVHVKDAHGNVAEFGFIRLEA